MLHKAREQLVRRSRSLVAVLVFMVAVSLIGFSDVRGLPQELLDGAWTIVPASYNAGLGYSDANNPVRSRITGIRFHVPGVSSHRQMSTTPIGISRVENGVKYTEYSGELSGQAFTSSVTGMSHAGYFKYVYGSIDENGVDHSHDADPGNFNQKTIGGKLAYLDRHGEQVLYDRTADKWFKNGDEISPWDNLPFIPVANGPVHERFGLRGVNFILKVPKAWNGTIIHYMHGGGLYWGNDSGALFINHFDENLILAKGYAYFATNGSGRTPDNSNHRMEPAIENYFAFLESPLAEKPMARVAEGYSVNGHRPCRGMNDEPMWLRDMTVVVSNLLKSVAGMRPQKIYLSTWSHSGGAGGLALSWGVTWGGLHFGGNHRVPYQNNSAPVYDGFIHFDPSYWITYYVDPDPKVRMSPAPVVIFTGSNSMTELSAGDDQISLTGALFAAKSHQAGNRTKNTIFFYTLENLPHIGYDVLFAVEKNGGGWFFDDSTFSVNQKGIGREMTVYFSRLVDILGVQNFMDLYGYWPYLTKDAPRDMGLYFQLIKNLDLYLEKGVKPPRSIIDPYWIRGSDPNAWPRNPWPEAQKFPQSPLTAIPQDTAAAGHFNLFDLCPRYKDVGSYIKRHDVLDYRAEAVRLPDDAARRGIYLTEGYVQLYASLFSDSELMNGFRTVDWNGEELVTLTMPNRRKIPGDGYGTHGGYVAAVAHAVSILVSERLFDPYLGARLIEEAAKSNVLKKSP